MSALLVLAIAVAVGARLRPPRPRPPDGPPRQRTRRSRRTTEPDWARFLDLVAADVRGGSSLRHAVAAAAGSMAVDPSLLERPGTGPSDRALVAQALQVAAQLGGAVAATVQQTANVVRERAAVRAEAAVHSAQARLSARVLTAVPLVFSGWSAVADHTFRRALLSPVGAAAAVAGLGCNLAGWAWMRRLIGQAVA